MLPSAPERGVARALHPGEAMTSYRTIDPTLLPKYFEGEVVEPRWADFWEREGVYRYDPTRPRAETFVVDTPPPTVSGSLHIGHVFSYTQIDVVVRYQRMRGKNIFYPMGWDDNGLPTERRVQNYFHVRVDVGAPQEKGLTIPAATPEQIKAAPPRLVSRPTFIDLCHDVTRRDEAAFMTLWRKLALSVDWRQEYATIDDRCRKLAQLSFLDLHEKGHTYSAIAPTTWDIDFQTAVAQAEIEDRPQSGALHEVIFGIQGGDDSFIVATTRPEFLPACVAVTAHPDDARYKKLFGRTAVTPLFHVPVRIFPSRQVDPEKGTGIVMVCTFGDVTDVNWWRQEQLPLRQVLDRSGRFLPIQFGEATFPSLRPAAANHCYAELVGKSIKQARAATVGLLRDPAHASAGTGTAPLRGEPVPV